MDNLTTDREFEKPDIRLNLFCLLFSPLSYVFFIYGGALAAGSGFAVLGLWILFVYSAPILGICALIIAVVVRKSRRNKLAALCFFLGQCIVALIIYRDYLKSFG